MNGPELLRIVDSMHREKNIPKEVIFDGIEAALLLAARKHYNEEESEDFIIKIDRATGLITARKGELTIDPTVLGRIAAQSAKQVMIQKIREAECNSSTKSSPAARGNWSPASCNVWRAARLWSVWAKRKRSCPRAR